MKCPNCGAEIPDGKLLCERCGHEITIVPEYDTVEQAISENMGAVTRAIAHDEKEQERSRQLLEQKARRHRQLRRFFAAAAVLLFAIGLTAGIFLYRRFHSVSYYVGEAYKASQSGKPDRAVELISRALALSGEDDGAELVLRLAEYQLRAGNVEDAAGSLKKLIERDGLSDGDRKKAYAALIDIYAAQSRYEEISSLVAGADETIQKEFAEYRIADPVFDAPSGEYENILYLSISADCDGSIFYTLDGSEPDTGSYLYQGAIPLAEGGYTVRAVAVNRYGVRSRVSEQHYEIGTAVPEAPEITPDSGSYSSPQLITAEVPEGGKVYYTTDGTDPTEESRLYTDPIALPPGTSHYRFAVITENGVSSEITDRRYSFSPTAKLSIEEGPNYILVALIRSGEVVDTVGTIRDGSARFSYYYRGLSSIGNYGNYYIYAEVLTDSLGNSAETGRRFAVNLTNKTVNLYEEQGGKPILVPIE